MISYLSLAGTCETCKIIEKSKFITVSRHVSGEEEAKAFITSQAQKYSDATHNCYAYIADNLGNCLRFSDDGEPQGTAGIPMLEVLKNNRLVEAAVVVTRYFGGIKLGAGGLVRAYSGAVAENISSAQKVSYEMSSEILYCVDYSGVDCILRFFAEKGAQIINTEYLDNVRFTVLVKKSEETEFNLALINALNGRVRMEKLRESYFPFKI